MRKHCWHSTGFSNHQWTAGDTVFRCCWCSVSVRVAWHIEERRMKGHGPGATEKLTVYDWPEDPCPGEVLNVTIPTGFRITGNKETE